MENCNKVGEEMHKGNRTMKIPAMVTVTITGDAGELYRELAKVLSDENKRRKAQGKEKLPFLINYQPTTRPSTVPQSI